jgi:4-aminobutyrate aminotransferase
MSNKDFETKLGPNAKAILERDREVMSPAYTREYPFVISHGKGAEVWDVDGKRYLDMTTGIAVTGTGHCHPKVVEAIKNQVDKFLHMAGTDFYYEPQVKLAERLSAIAPFDEPAKVFLCNSGTEAVEGSLKLARYYTKRPQYIGFFKSFHGRSMGSLAATSSKPVQRRGYFPTMPGFTHVPYPDTYRPILNMDGYSDYGERIVDYIENTLFQTTVPADEVAAILVEPLQGEGGYVVPTSGFFPALRRLCDKYGILLISDEVQAGVGRTGKWWAIEHFGVEPDIVASAKGIASGMPLGAVIARKSIMDVWPLGSHGTTFGGNPVSCAAANATLELFGDDEGKGGLIENAAEIGRYMLNRMQAMAPKHPTIGHVRGLGMMIGVELVKDVETREPAKEIRDAVLWRAFEKGLLIFGCGASTARWIPPLILDKATADEAMDIFEEALTEIEVEHGYNVGEPVLS